MKNLKAVEIEINSNCNRACSYCPNVSENRKEIGTISKELFAKILLELSQYNFSGRVSFSFYNEPLLVKEIDYFCKEVKSYLPNSQLVIYTNGTLLTTEKFHSLISNGVDLFIVTKHENENNYTFDDTFNDIAEDLKKKYLKYQNYTDLRLTNRGGLLPNIKKSTDTLNLPCLIPVNMLTITNQGTVIPCFEDYHQINSMGSLTKNSLFEIWNSIEYIAFRKKLSLGYRQDYKVCSTCNRNELIGIY